MGLYGDKPPTVFRISSTVWGLLIPKHVNYIGWHFHGSSPTDEPYNVHGKSKTFHDAFLGIKVTLEDFLKPSDGYKALVVMVVKLEDGMVAGWYPVCTRTYLSTYCTSLIIVSFHAYRRYYVYMYAYAYNIYINVCTRTIVYYLCIYVWMYIKKICIYDIYILYTSTFLGDCKVFILTIVFKFWDHPSNWWFI